MAYVENRTIHDADSHVMEFPDTICEYMAAPHLDELKDLAASAGHDLGNEPAAHGQAVGENHAGRKHVKGGAQ